MLGCSPGTRAFGIALLQSGVLIDWDVLTFRGPWSKDKLQDILDRIEVMIYSYDIREIALKIPDVFPVASSYNQLIGGLNVLLEKLGIEVHYYTLTELKSFCLPEGKSSKKTITDYLVKRHCELLPRCPKDRLPNNHHFKVFEAVCAAHLLRHSVCLKQQTASA